MVTHCKIIPPSSSGIAQSASNTIVQNKVNQRISEQNGKFIILHGIKKKKSKLPKQDLSCEILCKYVEQRRG